MVVVLFTVRFIVFRSLHCDLWRTAAAQELPEGLQETRERPERHGEEVSEETRRAHSEIQRPVQSLEEEEHGQEVKF